MGPSPLTRGNQWRFRNHNKWCGSIPAHAGQPWKESTGERGHGVHPRSRGATRPLARDRRIGEGPSPLTRGNPGLFEVVRRGQGSIPAHAGQPCRIWIRTICRRVHPRSRGATSMVTFRAGTREGPSPLTRGNL